jgi:hypothetical protein
MWNLHPPSATLTRTTLQIIFNMTFYAEFTTFVPDVTSIWSTARNRLLILLLNKYLTNVALKHNVTDLHTPNDSQLIFW